MIEVKIEEFDLEKTYESGQCFRWKKEDDTYFIPAFGKILKIRQSKNGIFELDCTKEEWQNIWYNYFDMDTDYVGIGKKIEEGDDVFLKKAYQFGKGIRILRQDLFETIISFLISQNNNIPRIKKSIEALYAEKNWDGLDFSDKKYGLGYRAEYLEKMLLYINENVTWLEELKKKTYQEAKKELLSHKGIGNKVAECICLFGLHHVDAFPIDTHIKQILSENYPNGFDTDKVKGYAGIAQQYMFFYDLKNKKEPEH